MEENNTINSENITNENPPQIPPSKAPFKLTTPIAIIIAGVLVGIFVMIAILLTRNHASGPSTPQTLSEQVGVSKDSMTACIKDSIANADALSAQINTSVNNAMSALPDGQRGTPYSVVFGLNGVKTDIQGALPYDTVKKVIDDALVGKVTTPYKGKIDPPTASDHVYGNPNATVTIIEYSDFECPYCKAFQPTLKRIVDESNGSVRWIYRNFPLHQDSFEELIAAECVAKIKGNDAYWKYGDLLFGLQDQKDTISQQL
jgi:hypothetical protein